MDKFERASHWLVNELNLTIDNHPNTEVVGWLKMLKESYLYNLNKEI